MITCYGLLQPKHRDLQMSWIWIPFHVVQQKLEDRYRKAKKMTRALMAKHTTDSMTHPWHNFICSANTATYQLNTRLIHPPLLLIFFLIRSLCFLLPSKFAFSSRATIAFSLMMSLRVSMPTTCGSAGVTNRWRRPIVRNSRYARVRLQTSRRGEHQYWGMRNVLTTALSSHRRLKAEILTQWRTQAWSCLVFCCVHSAYSLCWGNAITEASYLLSSRPQQKPQQIHGHSTPHSYLNFIWKPFNAKAVRPLWIWNGDSICNHKTG